jgi:hypothetical protein
MPENRDLKIKTNKKRTSEREKCPEFGAGGR